MFNPRYTITPELLDSLTKVERLYGQIEAEDLVPSVALRLQKENIVLATHHSTSIEGNPLSPTEVTNVILGDKVPTSKAEGEVKDYFDALMQLSEFERQEREISIELVKGLHAFVMRSSGDDRLGELRDGKVVVGHRELVEGAATIKVKHDPPAHSREEIRELLEELIEWTKADKRIAPILKAGIFHHWFVYIHPFYDGNGRVTRLLTSYLLMRAGYEVTRYFILDDYYDIDRFEYSDMLHSADDGDHTQWLEYFTGGLVHSLRASIAKIRDYKKEKLEDIKGERRALVTKREEDVLRIVMDLRTVRSSDISERLNVSRQQAYRLLNSLVEKDILKKHGKTKSTYYELRS